MFITTEDSLPSCEKQKNHWKKVLWFCCVTSAKTSIVVFKKKWWLPTGKRIATVKWRSIPVSSTSLKKERLITSHSPLFPTYCDTVIGKSLFLMNTYWRKWGKLPKSKRWSFGLMVQPHSSSVAKRWCTCSSRSSTCRRGTSLKVTMGKDHTTELVSHHINMLCNILLSRVILSFVFL